MSLRPTSVTMFTGDLKPDLRVTLSSVDGVDTTTALSVRVIGVLNGTQLFARPATSHIVDGDTTIVTMEWEAADTAMTGRLEVEVEVMWPDSKPQTYRAQNVIDILNDFDV